MASNIIFANVSELLNFLHTNAIMCKLFEGTRAWTSRAIDQ